MDANLAHAFAAVGAYEPNLHPRRLKERLYNLISGTDEANRRCLQFYRVFTRTNVDDTPRNVLWARLQAERQVHAALGMSPPSDLYHLEQAFKRHKELTDMTEAAKKADPKTPAAKETPKKTEDKKPEPTKVETSGKVDGAGAKAGEAGEKSAPKAEKAKKEPAVKRVGVIDNIRTALIAARDAKPSSAAVSAQDIYEKLKLAFPEKGDGMLTTTRIQLTRLPKKGFPIIKVEPAEGSKDPVKYMAGPGAKVDAKSTE